MKLRTRLALAFFLLAVLPLTAVTIYSYTTSEEAVRRLAAAEAGSLASELAHRMGLVAEDVQRRMDRFWQVEAPPGGFGRDGAPPDPAQLRMRVASALGATAGLVDQMEFVPSAPPAAASPASPPQPSPPGTAATPGKAAAPPPPPVPRQPGQPPRPSPRPPAAPGVPARGHVEIPSRIVVDLSALKELQRQIPEAMAASGSAAGKLTPEAQQMLQIQLRNTERVIREAQRLTAEAGRAQAAAERQQQQQGEMAQRSAEIAAKAASPGSPARPSSPAAPAPPGAEPPRGPGDAFPEFRHGSRMRFLVRREGTLVGTVDAEFNLERTLAAVMGMTHVEQGEIPFAVDTQQRLHTPNPENLAKLKALGLAGRTIEGTRSVTTPDGDWVVVSRRDPSGMTFGIARPISNAIRGVRRTAVENLGLGLSVVALAFIGIIPLSRRMTRNLSTLTAGAHQVAQGNLGARVPVRSRDEFGALAQAFNQMAQDLEEHQKMLVKQERLNRELELCREIQMDMLPRQPLRLGLLEVNGVSIPAREVGGDFFNYFVLPDGDLALLVGDVSGKGVGAALLMANVQATLQARLPLDPDLRHLVDAVDREIEQTTPRGVYLTLFVGIFSPASKTLRYVNAGHNPQFVVRASGELGRLPSTGLPVGLFAGHGYQERSIVLAGGDALFFYTDGMVEVENEAGEMFGSERLETLLIASRGAGRDTLLADVEQAVRAFRGEAEPYDDATMMLLRLGAPPEAAATR
jgi:serine phosphatase RsbU (regulator of sigma subunit)